MIVFATLTMKFRDDLHGVGGLARHSHSQPPRSGWRDRVSWMRANSCQKE